MCARRRKSWKKSAPVPALPQKRRAGTQWQLLPPLERNEMALVAVFEWKSWIDFRVWLLRWKGKHSELEPTFPPRFGCAHSVRRRARVSSPEDLHPLTPSPMFGGCVLEPSCVQQDANKLGGTLCTNNARVKPLALCSVPNRSTLPGMKRGKLQCPALLSIQKSPL